MAAGLRLSRQGSGALGEQIAVKGTVATAALGRKEVLEDHMKILSVVLVVSMFVHDPVPRAWSQVPAEEPAPKKIAIVVVEGEGGMNNLGQRANRIPGVRVEDENQKPVAGASVVFTLPADGASGEFRNGSKTLVVQTDERGMAVAQGLKANQVAGRLPVHVNASHRGLTARANITQFNMAVPGKRPAGSRKALAVILAVAGGAAAGGYVAATRKSGPAPSPSGAAPIGITVGGGSVGPPR